MAQTLENIKIFLEFMRRMAAWDTQLQYELTRAGENQTWGVINLLKQQMNYPFPSTFDVLKHQKVNLADGAQDSNTFSKTDWGENKHCYIIGLGLFFTSANEFNISYENGVLCELLRNSDAAYLWGKTISESPRNIAVSALWILAITSPFDIPRQILNSDVLLSRISNESGQIINFTGQYYYFTEEI